jgi:hypothetical protein
MYKLAWFEHLQEGADRAAALRQLNETAGRLAAEIPGLESYVRSDATGPMPSESGASEQEVFFDSYTCCWFADRDGFERARTTDEWRALVDASAAACDVDWQRGMSASLDERTIKEGPRSPFKAVWVLRFRPDIDRDWAREFWTNDHAKFVLEAPGVDRYLQNHVNEEIDTHGIGVSPSGKTGYDGFAECWFPGRDAYDAAVLSPAWAGLVEEGALLFDMTFLWGAILDEHAGGKGEA